MSLPEIVNKVSSFVEIKSIIVLIFVITICSMYIRGIFVPIELLSATLVIVGMYFGYLIKKDT